MLHVTPSVTCHAALRVTQPMLLSDCAHPQSRHKKHTCARAVNPRCFEHHMSAKIGHPRCKIATRSCVPTLCAPPSKCPARARARTHPPHAQGLDEREGKHCYDGDGDDQSLPYLASPSSWPRSPPPRASRCQRNIADCGVTTARDYYHRCRKATSEGYLHVRRDRTTSPRKAIVAFSVTPSAKGHRLRVNCPPEVSRTHRTCLSVLDARGRLHSQRDSRFR